MDIELLHVAPSRPAMVKKASFPGKSTDFRKNMAFFCTPISSREGSPKMHHVVALSDEPILIEGLRNLLVRMEDLNLSAVCPDHNLLFDYLQRGGCPDLFVVQVTSSITVSVLGRLKSMCGRAEIVLWVEDVEPEFCAQALGLGIRAFLPRSSALELYAECFRAVLAGGIWMPAELNRKLRSANEENLTPRQRQLAMLLVQGLKNKEIAWKMGITEGTVKVYLSHLFQKVGANDRFEFALLALKNMTPNQAADLWSLDAKSHPAGTPFFPGALLSARKYS